MKKRGILISVIGVILLIAVLNLSGAFKKKDETKKPEGPPKGMATSVKAIVLKPEAMENKIQITGTVFPNEEVEL